MKNMNELVSVIMPAYNAATYIKESIRSIQEQEYVNWELLIVDDFSTDDTIEVVSNISKLDSRIRLYALPQNSGAAVARNKAIEMSKGRFIAFLDSDDLWKPNKLSSQIPFMLEKNIALSYSNYDVMDEHGKTVKRTCPRSVSYSDLLKTNYISCLTAVYDTRLVGKVYMPLIRKRQDFALWLKILKKTPEAHCLTENLATYRIRSGSISSNKLDAARYTWRLYREVERLNLWQSIYYFANYALRGVLRRS